MWCLDAPIQPYAWGSRSSLAMLQGRPAPTDQPEAELWMGAHPRAPSRLRDGRGTSLLEAIEARPEAMLGPAVCRRFGARLPFLLKVLAAAEPLSLQAHPDATRARAGWEREEAAGIDRDAPDRNYRDPWPKPELVCALGPFSALCGFAPVERSRAWIERLAVPTLRELAEPLWSEPVGDGLAATVRALLTMPEPAAVVDAVVEACRREHEREAGLTWPMRLGESYPGDPGVLVALLLRQVELRAGEALFLGPGRLHCYLQGTAVEIMGSSDNVLRGGLTRKHVDVPELLSVLHRGTEAVEVVRPRAVSATEGVYDTPTPEFSLSSLELPAAGRSSIAITGPELLLCVEGEARVHGEGEPLILRSGHAVFVPGSAASYELRAAAGARVFRATVGER
ncbi:MAG: mannose-6-phosphate isomerase, class I [Myxococcales bacterium]|nr:mannose-6-phosphate isomerase, class I [Myxococcales bacterium]MCB9715112.1 mannose-6-phosphate isomerase, class I [Myxococcales bacterium]